MAYIIANFGIVYKLCFFMTGISNLNGIQDLCYLVQEFQKTPTYMQAVDWNMALDNFDRHGIARHVNH